MLRSFTLFPGASRQLDALLRRVGLTVAAGAVLAIIGPFGSYMNGDLLQRAGYWVGAMLLGLVLYGSALKIVGRLTTTGSRAWWAALMSASILVSLPQALVTRWMAFQIWPELSQLDLSLPVWFSQTATIGLLSMAMVAILLRRSGPTANERHAFAPPTRALKVSLGSDILALQMEDHYVRVHRLSGSELILMPLGQAIDCVQASGLRTHRSWWVARDAVVAIEGNARAMRLILSNGLVAPVARPAVAHLKAAKWVD